jgi:hypothetical protein
LETKTKSEYPIFFIWEAIPLWAFLSSHLSPTEYWQISTESNSFHWDATSAQKRSSTKAEIRSSSLKKGGKRSIVKHLIIKSS